jgi:hypothetical protein
MQKNLFPPTHLEHGGSIRKGLRKLARPFDRRRPMHIVMRSNRAYGTWSFLHRRNKGTVFLLVLDTAARYQIRIYSWENVGNHLHFAAKAPSRRALRAFLRVLPQRIMFVVTGARKGRPRGRFFHEIAYSRIVNWGREWKVLLRYIWKNTLEALGFSAEEIRRMRKAARQVPI